MRILITTQVYPPERHPTAVMVQEFARFLGTRGHHVTVACGFPHHPSGLLPKGVRKRVFLREGRGGIDVVRGWHLTSASSSMLVRAAVMISQALGTTAAAYLARSKPDIVVNYGPPLIGPLLTWTIANRANIPVVNVVYDIYPDVAVETGLVTNRFVIDIARRIERRVYRTSDLIVVLSEGFRRSLIMKHVTPDKVAVVPVWLDQGEIVPSPRENSWRAEQGISSSAFVILYAGTIGIVSGAEVMVEVADRLRNVPNLIFLFVGEGQLKDALQGISTDRGLKNVRFLPFQDRARLNEVQATSDISVVTLAKGRGRTSVPSKVVGYMAAGRPVIASVDEDSDTALCVRAGPSGIVVPPADAEKIAEAILLLRSDPAKCTAIGIAGRQEFEATHDASSVLDRYACLLEQLEKKSR